jgi:lactoylglutathione lyase
MSEHSSLGSFYPALTVQDLAASQAFYEALGFQTLGGMPEQGWLILRNGSVVLGLYQGMFERNTLTFNPGWGQDAQALESFEDVRAIKARLEAAGIETRGEIDPESTGPAHFIAVDPDGNPVLFDQHVPKPG